MQLGLWWDMRLLRVAAAATSHSETANVGRNRSPCSGAARQHSRATAAAAPPTHMKYMQTPTCARVRPLTLRSSTRRLISHAPRVAVRCADSMQCTDRLRMPCACVVDSGSKPRLSA